MKTGCRFLSRAKSNNGSIKTSCLILDCHGPAIHRAGQHVRLTLLPFALKIQKIVKPAYLAFAWKHRKQAMRLSRHTKILAKAVFTKTVLCLVKTKDLLARALLGKAIVSLTRKMMCAAFSLTFTVRKLTIKFMVASTELLRLLLVKRNPSKFFYIS